MTDTLRHHPGLLIGGAGALAALVALGVVAGPRLGIDCHETLISLTRRLALWVIAAGLSFVTLRPLRPATGTGTGR
ncbi:hypothetical protein GCM10020358_57670 [Amorphoplanes nipponensis]|uniref:Uncharacterized protein n=1 Tax=Actinoplanes nipponensis TaxID=135950 RepID=A0A919JJ92_9ACTN|nr:hypothetical protein [Actinoplanes nipponensis]GIE47799.1 hypothetical protein Ani05nite_13330 [Actinoplanes nipponensis]